MCIYGSASFLSSCQSSSMQQWTISPQLKRENNSKKGARYNPLCFFAFWKHHGSHRVVLIHHCDNRTLTICVSTLYLTFFPLGWRETTKCPSLWDPQRSVLSPPFFVAEVRDIFSLLSPPSFFYFQIPINQGISPVSETDLSMPSYAPCFLFLSCPKTRWMTRSFLEKCAWSRNNHKLNICFLWSSHLRPLLEEYPLCKLICWNIMRGRTQKGCICCSHDWIIPSKTYSQKHLK